MKQCIKLEIRRVLHSRWLYMSLGISLLLAIFQVYQQYGPVYLDYYDYPKSVYNHWLGGEPVSFSSRYLKLIFPVLVALPFSHTLCTDKKTGYIANICTRARKNQYICSKYLVTFCIGAFTGAFPYVLNFLIAMALYPMLPPQMSTNVFMGEPASFMADLLVFRPMLYVILYLLIYVFYCGLMSITSLSIGVFAKNVFVVIFTPVISLFIFGNFMLALRLVQLIPFTAFDPSQPARTNGVSLLVLCAVPLLFSVTVMTRESKNETL